MTRDEALTITQMILTHWHGAQWTKEEIDVYARLIQDMPAEITTHAVISLAKTQQYRPSVSELREKVRSERRKLLPAVESIEHQPKPLPDWVKEWLCARFLYAQFNRPRDMRRFSQQLDWGDATQETMPEGAWSKEAATVTDQGFEVAFRKLFKS